MKMRLGTICFRHTNISQQRMLVMDCTECALQDQQYFTTLLRLRAQCLESEHKTWSVLVRCKMKCRVPKICRRQTYTNRQLFITQLAALRPPYNAQTAINNLIK